MTAAWIVYLLLVGALLTIGAAAISSALALSGRSTRWVWVAALAGVAVLAAVAPRMEGRRRMDVPSDLDAPRVVQVARTPERRGVGAIVESARATLASAVATGIASVDERIPRALGRPALLAWALASGALLALYLIVNARFVVARRGWPATRLHDVPVRVAPFAGPAVIGLVRAEIVVPRSLLRRSAEEQRLIITHEHEHLRAGDHLLLGLACLFVIALPWHPAVWYILARLRLAIELDCDARVLRRGAAPRSYGALLIDMAAHGAGIRVGTLALADRPSHLERRLLAMKTIRSRYAMVRGGALTAVAGLLVLVACEAKIPTAQELSSMDAAALEKSIAEGASSTQQMKTAGPGPDADYFVDGVKKTRDEALALKASDLASMEIVKGTRDTVMLTSVKAMLFQTQLDGPTRARVPAPGETRTIMGVITPEGQRLAKQRRANAPRPEVTINDVPVSWSAFETLRGEDIASMNVLKPNAANGLGARYPNGLLAVKLHTAATRAGSMKERTDLTKP